MSNLLPDKCITDDCGNHQWKYKRGYCIRCYARWKRHGDPRAGRQSLEEARQRKCSFDGCDERHYSKGYCRIHYVRWKNHGDPQVVITPDQVRHPKRTPEQVLADFKARLKRSPEGCLEWQGARDPNGYGRIFWEERVQLAHRAAYDAFVGPIPAGMNVCHRCDNPPCCEPTHLFIGSQADNHADMTRKGRGSVPPSKLGTESSQSKLTEADVRAIRKARSEGIPVTTLAAQYGVSTSSLSAAATRKTWKHVA